MRNKLNIIIEWSNAYYYCLRDTYNIENDELMTDIGCLQHTNKIVNLFS